MAHQLPNSEPSRDPLECMRVYRLARDLVPDSYRDASILRADPLTQSIATQLYASVSSIAANLGEGYSRSSGRDRARLFEYALGSVRESMEWYHSTEPIVGEDLTLDRLNRLEEMRRLLLAIIPRERGRKMK